MSDALAKASPESLGTYMVEVTCEHAVIVFKVEALSRRHAVEQALAARSISARVVSAPPEHIAEDAERV